MPKAPQPIKIETILHRASDARLDNLINFYAEKLIEIEKENKTS